MSYLGFGPHSNNLFFNSLLLNRQNKETVPLTQNINKDKNELIEKIKVTKTPHLNMASTSSYEQPETESSSDTFIDISNISNDSFGITLINSNESTYNKNNSESNIIIPEILNHIFNYDSFKIIYVKKLFAYMLSNDCRYKNIIFYKVDMGIRYILIEYLKRKFQNEYYEADNSVFNESIQNVNNLIKENKIKLFIIKDNECGIQTPINNIVAFNNINCKTLLCTNNNYLEILKTHTGLIQFLYLTFEDEHNPIFSINAPHTSNNISLDKEDEKIIINQNEVCSNINNNFISLYKNKNDIDITNNNITNSNNLFPKKKILYSKSSNEKPKPKFTLDQEFYNLDEYFKNNMENFNEQLICKSLSYTTEPRIKNNINPFIELKEFYNKYIICHYDPKHLIEEHILYKIYTLLIPTSTPYVSLYDFNTFIKNKGCILKKYTNKQIWSNVIICMIDKNNYKDITNEIINIVVGCTNALDNLLKK